MSAATASYPMMPSISTCDPSFSPSSFSSLTRPVGSRYENPPHAGPGKATYVVQPSRAELKANNGLFADPLRPYWYRDPEGRPFIDIDGKECGPRWIYVNPRPLREPSEGSSNSKCTIM